MRGFIRWLLPGLAVVCAAVAGVAVSAFAGPTGAAQTGSEQIVSYNVVIAIQHDASILVTEQIVYDFGSSERHGIMHDIPVRYRYNKDYDRYYPLVVRSVQSADAPAQYTANNTGNSVVFKIGDPSRTVTGVHTYQLTYLVRGSMNAFASHDELYWNAIGGGWNVPIQQATVRVTAPAVPLGVACWAGPRSSTSACQQSRMVKGIAAFRQDGLGPHEGVTVAVALPKGVVASPRPVLIERWSLQHAFALTPASLSLTAGLLVILAILGTVLVIGRHRQHAMSAVGLAGGPPGLDGGVAPWPGHEQPPMESAPPEGLRPGQAGTLLDGVANPRDVTATIVDLAVRGYLRIEDSGGGSRPDWRLVRLSKTGGVLDYEQILLDGLFAEESLGTRAVRLSELGSDFTVYLELAQEALYKDVAKRGWFTARPDRVRRKWLGIGLAIFLLGVAAVILTAASSHFALVPVPIALAGLAVIAGRRWMPVRTAKGTALARRAEGFRRFITTAAVAQAHPAGQPETLYDYLPYAIAFGCTKEWAELTGSLGHTGQPPSWYQTRTPFTPGRLSSLPRSSYYFSSMHHCATTVGTSIANNASATGSSAFSGGGGFAGGGGGGGGGGSW